MLKILFIIAMSLQATTQTAPDSGRAHLDAVFADVRAQFSGDNAMETARFVATLWRWPGNRAFDRALDHVEERLVAAGFVNETDATENDRLTYRIESRPMRDRRGDPRPSWEPVAAELNLHPSNGGNSFGMKFDSNRNMIAINSHPTQSDKLVRTEVVYVGAGTTKDFEGVDVRNKIVFGDASAWQLYRTAVQRNGAIGVLAYAIPDFNRPDEHPESVPFSAISLDPRGVGWAINLSTRVRDQLRNALERGPVEASVFIDTWIEQREERTIIADVRGSATPEERFVFSAHVQEPGANDNASGVAVQTEMGRVLAALVKNDQIDPQRTITMIWGDEIAAPARYIRDDPERTAGVRWAMSLDMVGADPEKTGGVFLVEKMPDPSAVWTRGDDKHTEWGSSPMTLDDMQPHYFNDFVLNRLRDQAETTGWKVRANPYEGGSDHVPFLRADKPAVLLWHFTDVFYHTDGDVIENLSAATMKNAGVAALTTALWLCTADAKDAKLLVNETRRAAVERLEIEAALSRDEINNGAELVEQTVIIDAWRDWYVRAIAAIDDIVLAGGHDSADVDALRTAMIEVAAKIDEVAARIVDDLRAITVETPSAIGQPSP